MWAILSTPSKGFKCADLYNTICFGCFGAFRCVNTMPRGKEISNCCAIIVESIVRAFANNLGFKVLQRERLFTS